MNESGLTTTSASGTQSNVENPQTAGGPANAGAVQPGTTSTLLDNASGGLPLTSQELTAVELPKTSTSVAQPAAPARQENSPVATGLSILFFVIAALVIAAIFFPAKNTTE